MRSSMIRSLPMAAMALSMALLGRVSVADVVDFEDLSLAPNSYWNGPDTSGVTEPDPYGGSLPVYVGSFQSRGASFVNRYNANYGNWNGFAYSNVNNPTTAGYENQFAAVTGTGHGGSGNYAIGTGYHDLAENDTGNEAFDPSNPAHMNNLPFVDLPQGKPFEGTYITNNAYAYFAMKDGDLYSGEKFGGADGNREDWLLLTVFGTDAMGRWLGNRVDFYLADFRFANNALDYIVKDWTYLDLTPLQDASRIVFNISGSRAPSGPNEYGLATPAYFAMDDLVVTSVPEPASLLALSIGSSLTWIRYRRRRSG